MRILGAKFINKIYVLSSLLGLSLLFANTVKAEENTFIFHGSVDGVCEFRDIIKGSLGLSIDGKTFDTIGNGGSQASATIFCTQNAQLQVDAPVLASSETFAISSSWTRVELDRPILADETIVATNDATSPLTTLYGPILFFYQPEYDVTINMSVTSDQAIPAGNHVFIVRLTLSP